MLNITMEATLYTPSITMDAAMGSFPKFIDHCNHQAISDSQVKFVLVGELSGMLVEL